MYKSRFESYPIHKSLTTLTLFTRVENPLTFYSRRVLHLYTQKRRIMDNAKIYKIRAELNAYGIPTKSITLLKGILTNPGISTTDLGVITGISKQAVSKHLIPLEKNNVLTNSHPHPLYKAWSITDNKVEELLKRLP